ncbi:MAG: glycosyl hydrolase 53 family protein [Phycisphaerae bacterium]
MSAAEPFYTGSDVLFYGYISAHGGVYRYDHKPVGLLQAFKLAHCNTLRLRLFHRATPAERAKYGLLPTLNNLAYTLPLAQKIVKAGFYFVLDMHVSYTWAGPRHRHTPAAWQHLSASKLKARLGAYCYRVISTLRRNHAMPQIVMVGNEINNGLLWPVGKLWVHHRARWNHVASLLRVAIAGIDHAAGPHRPLIMIQVYSSPYAPMFYRELVAHGVHFDLVGMDFYPGGGQLKTLRTDLDQVARAVHKPIIVAETAYPWIDNKYNYKWARHKRNMLFPFTPAGQAAYMRDVIKIVKSIPSHLGRGVWAWGGEFTLTCPRFRHKPWTYRSLFGSHGNALPAMNVLGAAARGNPLGY